MFLINPYIFGKTLKTGNFVIMTSNTTPAGFTVSYNFSISAGGPAYVAFDNKTTNYVQDNNIGGAYLQINFPKIIKPKKIGLRTGSPSLQLIGIKEDNSEVILLSNAISNTYTIFDVPEYELKALKLYKPSATGAGFMAIYECQITEWYEMV